ncbi:MAG: CapA family protein [Bacilli bacterium]
MKTTIGFTGDTAFSEYTKDLYKYPEKIDKEIYNFLEQNDYNILNFESPITETTKTKKSALAHKSDVETLDFIKNNIKNPIFSLANNHMMDFGPKGLKDTLKNVKKAKIEYIGAGKNIDDATKYIILGKDVKVGVLSFQYKNNAIATLDECGVAHEKHSKIIKKKIKELKSKVDWVVLIYHGGEEFLNSPMPYTKRKFKKFLSWGVDVIVGHHPHTIQGYEKLNGKLVFYSLGNFIFDTDFQRAQKGTDKGVCLSLEFTKDSYSFKNIIVKNDRENEKLIKETSDPHFKDIAKTWKKEWKKEAGRLEKIKENRQELRKYRNMFSISNLHIEKAECNNLIPFNDLVKKYHFKELDEPLVFEGSNIFVRKIRRIYRKITKANYNRFGVMLLAKIFRW